MNTYNSPVNYGIWMHYHEEPILKMYWKSQNTPCPTLNWTIYWVIKVNYNFRSIGKQNINWNISTREVQTLTQYLNQFKAEYLTD